MGLQVGGQLRGNRLAENFVGHRGPVAGVADQTDFILQLDHDGRAAGRIAFLNVPHEGREGLRIGVPVGGAQRGQNLDGLAARELSARETVLVRHDPGRGEVGEPVLPTPEPEPRDVHLVGSRVPDDVVGESEIELTLFGLDPGPGHRSQDRIEPHLRQMRPRFLHVLGTGGGGVHQLAGQGQERLAVDDKLCRCASFLQMGDGRGGRRGLGARGHQSQRADQGKASTLHTFRYQGHML